MTEHKELNQWVRECAELCQPDRVVWIDGSEEQRRALLDESLKTGDFIRLNQDKLPGCYYHRSALNDVARTEGLTYVCTATEEDAGPTNNWMPPEEAYDRAAQIFAGSMRGRTLYVIPFSMGPIGSPFSKIGVEITDSIYVVISMMIMTRTGRAVLDQLGASGEFTRCLHGKADLDLKRRLILHFPQDNTIWSVGSGYGGNALLGKKCLSLRIAGYLARKEGWMAEHMLIMGIEHPDGHIDYIAGAFPSACGKTNLAMLVPPETLAKKGYKVWTIGDDIAWMRIGPDGRLYAINPETGFFGVAPGTNPRSNPNALRTVQRNSLFTNTVLCPDGTVWWDGLDGEPPAHGCLDWTGAPWWPGKTDEHGKRVPGAHPNSRFTAPACQCPSIAPNWEDPQGVPITPGSAPRAPCPTRLSVLQLAARRLRRGHHGLRAHRRPGRQVRRNPPRPHGDAPVLRLQHGRLLPPLAQHGQADAPSPQGLPRQLVPPGRRRQLHLAGLQREPPHPPLGPRALPRPRRSHQDPHRLHPDLRRH